MLLSKKKIIAVYKTNIPLLIYLERTRTLTDQYLQSLKREYSKVLKVSENGMKPDVKEKLSSTEQPNFILPVKRSTSNSLFEVGEEKIPKSKARVMVNLQSDTNQDELIDDINSNFKAAVGTRDDMRSSVGSSVWNAKETEKDIKASTVGSQRVPTKKDFIKTFLKVKFEKMHVSHKGQDTDHNILWKEVLREKIPESEWNEYVFARLNGRYGKFGMHPITEE